MVSTNDKKVREAVKAHILYHWKGLGGKTALIETINEIRSNNPYNTGYRMAREGEYLIYDDDIRKFLHKLGFTDDRRLDKFRYRDMAGVSALYAALLARGHQEIYDEYVKVHGRKRYEDLCSCS